MKLDLTKIFPKAAAEMGLKQVFIESGAMREFGTRTVKPIGFTQPERLEHFIWVEGGIVHKFDDYEEDKEHGIEVLRALDKAFTTYNNCEPSIKYVPAEEAEKLKADAVAASKLINDYALKYC